MQQTIIEYLCRCVNIGVGLNMSDHSFTPACFATVQYVSYVCIIRRLS
jgi:hypothetical protein